MASPSTTQPTSVSSGISTVLARRSGWKQSARVNSSGTVRYCRMARHRSDMLLSSSIIQNQDAIGTGTTRKTSADISTTGTIPPTPRKAPGDPAAAPISGVLLALCP